LVEARAIAGATAAGSGACALARFFPLPRTCAPAACVRSDRLSVREARRARCNNGAVLAVGHMTPDGGTMIDHGGVGGESGATTQTDEPNEVPIEALAARITALRDAFRRCASRTEGLRVEVVGPVSGAEELVHPVAGFTARLERAAEGGVALYVSAAYAELTRWGAPSTRAAGARRERFRVRLDEKYGWGDADFPTAEELAQALIGYMHYKLEAPV
jgi:hypothetical protein